MKAEYQERKRGRWKNSLQAGLALLLACGSEGDRAAHHLRQAEALLAENRGRAGLIELHNAARLRPDDVDLSLHVAEISLRYGYFGDAVDFYRDALSLRPEDIESELKLAQVLLEIDPVASKARIDGVIARDPRNAKAWLIRARAALIDGDVESALQHVSKARRIDNAEPEIDRVMALAYEARGRAARSRNPLAVPSPQVTRSILRAYDRYLAKNGEYPVLGYLGRARTLARLPGRSDEALEAFGIALDKGQEVGSPHEAVRVAREAARFGQRMNDTALARRAIDQWIATTPRDLGAWRALADLQTQDPTAHKQQVYRNLIGALPDLPAAHVLYAQYLLDEQGYSTAMAHLNQRLGRSDNDAELLIGIISIQNLSQRFADAQQTLVKLQTQFPDRPTTALATGEQQVILENFDAAVASLNAGLHKHATPRGYRILARAEQQRGNLVQALAAIDEAIALDEHSTPNNLRLKAQIQTQLGQHRDAGATLLRLQHRVPLSRGERLSLALSYYLRGAPGIGRKMLVDLLDGDNPGPRAALEFARWDGQSPQHRPAVRRYLVKTFNMFPRNRELLEALTEMDMADGLEEEARRRLNATIQSQSWIGSPYLVRGNFLLRHGEFVAARDDAERALKLDPSTLDEAYDIMTVAYMNDGDLSNLVAAMEARFAEHGLAPDRMGLLARLNLAAGNSARALELYDRAFSLGSNLVFVKNDLAFLLASSGGDLDRALSLAQRAAEAPGENVSTVDTLGYVYLKLGKPDAAVWQFRQAVAESETPIPDYYYHLGLALIELGRTNQAREALEEALALSPDFPDAPSARKLLSGLGSADLGAKEPAS